MEAAVDAIVVIDHRGRILAANDATGRTFGYRSDEMLGENVGLLMPESERAEHDRHLAEHLKTGRAQIIGIGREVTARRKDGSHFPVRLSVGRIADVSPARFVGLIRDISAERSATAALRLQHDRAKAFLELHDAILLDLDPGRRIREINTRGAEVLNGIAEQIAGRDWLDFIRGDAERVRARELLDAALADGEARDLELEVTDARGMPRRIHWRCIALREAGSPAGWLCSGVDVTSRALRDAEARAAQDRMARVARMATVGEMAAGIAHEINQPLTTITTWARACERYLDGPVPDMDELRSGLREISAEGLRAGEIVRRLRRLARTDNGPRSRIDVNAVLNELATLLHADATSQGVEVRMRLAANLPPIEADVVQIQHVVLILVRNALEALGEMPEGLRIVEILTGITHDGEVEIRVTDNGPGIAPAVADRLFDPFATTKLHGTGLGLAICRALVHAHGGKIGSSRENPPGASFYVRLPVAEVLHA